MNRRDKTSLIGAAVGALTLLVVVTGYVGDWSKMRLGSFAANAAEGKPALPDAVHRHPRDDLTTRSVDLSAAEFAKFKVEPVLEDDKQFADRPNHAARRRARALPCLPQQEG